MPGDVMFCDRHPENLFLKMDMENPYYSGLFMNV